MKTLAVIFIVMSSPAFAHVGHWGGFAGHDHWIAAGALGAAALAAWLASKGKKKDTEAEPKSEELEEEAAEA